MSDKVFDKVTEYIDALAAQLGVAGEYVFATLVKQAFISGLIYTIFLPVLFVASTYFVVRIVYYAKRKANDHSNRWGVSDWDVIATTAMVIGSVIVGILLIAVIINLPGSIAKIVNPEYYAIRELLGVIAK